MPYFKEGRSKRKVNLPSNDKYWVEIFTDIKWGQSKHALTMREDGTIDMILSADKLLQMLIVDWNLDGEDGNKVPIDEEHIDMLDPSDALFLCKEAGADDASAADAKKNSPKS